MFLAEPVFKPPKGKVDNELTTLEGIFELCG
jgi:hypothetical protein